MLFPDGVRASAHSRLLDLGEGRFAYAFVLSAPPVTLEQVEGALEQQSRNLAGFACGVSSTGAYAGRGARACGLSSKPSVPHQERDELLVRDFAQAQRGDRAALEQLVAGLQQPLYGLALRMLWHPEDARDATQEILLKVMTRLDSFLGESAVNDLGLTGRGQPSDRRAAEPARGAAVHFRAFCAGAGRGSGHGNQPRVAGKVRATRGDQDRMHPRDAAMSRSAPSAGLQPR